MPNWLIPLLKWGGIALAVVFAIAVVYMEPMPLYWVLLVVGVVAAIAGFVLDRPKAHLRPHREHGMDLDLANLSDDELESELAQVKRELEDEGDTTRH